MRTPARRWLVAVSLVVHCVVVLGLFVAGFWRLDRLDATHRKFDLAVAMPPPPAPAGGATAAAAKPLVPKKPRHIPPVIVSPPQVKPDVQADPAPTATGIGDGSAIGPGVGPGSDDMPGTCEVPPCGPPTGEGPKPPEPAKPPVVTPTLVTPSVIAGLRTSGDTQIRPADPVKVEIARDGARRVTASFKLCLATTGEVTSVAMLKSSHYASYDAALSTAIHAWRYRPYLLDGRAVPACGIVTFVYAIE